MNDFNFRKYNILTYNRGMIDSQDVTIGDTLIEYGTNAPLKIIDIEHVPSSRPYIVKFNDNRELILDESDYTFQVLNKHMSSYRQYLVPQLYTNVTQFSKRVTAPLKIDPYLAAASLFANKEMNVFGIPVNKVTYNNQFKWTYSTKYHRYVKDHLIVFEDINTSSLVTWDQMFPHGIDLNQYTYSRIIDRMRFIRGAFDVGYDPNFSTDTIAITHKDLEIIEYIQWILWSLGVTSRIITRPYVGGDIFVLSLIGNYSSYPGFFYNVEAIELVGSKSRHTPFNLDIDSIEPLNDVTYRNENFHTIMHLNKEHALYLTPNFLYMIS